MMMILRGSYVCRAAWYKIRCWEKSKFTQWICVAVTSSSLIREKVPELLMKKEETVAGNGDSQFPNLRENMSEGDKGTTEKMENVEECCEGSSEAFSLPRIPFTFPWNSRSFLYQNSRQAGNFVEYSATKKGTASTATLYPDLEHHRADSVPFTPELVGNSAQDTMNEYRFLCTDAGQYQCKITGLVFAMEGKGEVQYKIISWDYHVLEELGQMEPAGPLYNIECHEGLVRRLHFPHSETRKDKVKLAVVHLTGGDVEFIQPLTVTDTHVVINIPSFSCFGLTVRCSGSLIRAQVLLFYKKMTAFNRIQLQIHLLPANVPVQEVQQKHENYTYLETTSNCYLIPGKKYRPSCKTRDHDCAPKPQVVKFHRDCGPNYHPTFMVNLNIDEDEVTVIVLDKKGKEVWTASELLLGGTEAASTNLSTAGAEFVDRHREKLIQRFHSVMQVADILLGKKMIPSEMYSNIHAKSTPQEKMRELYECFKSSGNKAKQEFYEILEKEHNHLLQDFKSEQSQA